MSASPSPPATALVSGFASLAPRFDVIFCDIWGVLHDGLHPFASSSDALVRFREGGGSVVLVSNAPRPGEIVAAQLDEIGVPRAAYDDIVTSGDLSRQAVAARPGKAVYHLGPQRDAGLFHDLPVRLVGAEEAEYVVCTGLVDDESETVEDYRDALAAMRARDVWMVCANPDLVVERGDRLILCAGALGTAYEALGGDVYFPGKPYRPVYEAALAKATALRGAAPDLGRVLGLGDAIRTDIAGGAAFGIATLLLARGIHAGELVWSGRELDEAALRIWLARQDACPTFVAGELSWA